MENPLICVVGLGYVGLPLAVELSLYYSVRGFDINQNRIDLLRSGKDPNNEVPESELVSSSLSVSSDPAVMSGADIIIVAVPTPIDSHKTPDLTPVVRASEIVGGNMKRGAIVVYESTVYPGVTEELCVSVLERVSGLKWKKDFFVGYSPERINPGDREHTFSTITKVVSGDTPETLETVAAIYARAVTGGVHRAPSIKVAEAAKVIENTQRDINIALMNELRIIFDKIGISTRDVLEAAKTKWNFLPFTPGLVGGHCIGVDPYYLAYKAEEYGHHPQLILAGRRINDAMGRYFARTMIKKLIDNECPVKNTRILICGMTFKENVPDIRNSRIIDIVREMEYFGIRVDVWDPQASADEVEREYGISLCRQPSQGVYDGCILAVKHREFLSLGRKGLESFCKPGSVVYDIQEVFESATPHD